MQIGEVHFTGNEDAGVCWYCGSDLPPRRRRWCSDTCEQTYWETWHWNSASLACARRDNDICQNCHRRKNHRWGEEQVSLEVHHLIPMNGEERSWSRLNEPSNLVTLCHECHLLAHAEMRLEARGQKVVVAQVVDKRQGVLL